MSRKWGLLRGSGLALLAATSFSAACQAAERQHEATELDELIVTATKRQERLIDVPIAVTAVSGAALENSGVRDIRDLVSLVPSLNVATPGGDSDSTLRLRGIGTISTNVGLESAVGIVIDGVVRARVGSALSELGDVERIEVLRGPQGTLYGANTSAGLVNIVTETPNETEVAGYLEAAGGNYGYRRVAGAVSGPITPWMSGRLEAISQQRGGFLYEVNSRQDLNTMNRYFFRGRLRLRPTEHVRIDLIADYTSRDENCCSSVLYRTGASTAKVNAFANALGLVGYPSLNPFDRVQALTPGRDNQEDVRDGGVSAEVNWDLGWANFVSVSSYRNWRAWRAQDFDHSGVPYTFIPHDGLRMGLRQYTQEARLQGATPRLDWLVGVYSSNQTIDQDLTYAMDAGYAEYNGGASAFKPGVVAVWRPGDYARGISRQKGQNYALFTHNTFKLTERLGLTGGLRYTVDRKSVSVASVARNPACDVAVATNDVRGVSVFCSFFFDTRVNTSSGPAVDSRTEQALSGTAVLNYEFSDNLKGYVSYSRGYKSGGYNLDRYGFSTPASPRGSDLAFGDETTDAYEAGLKGQFLDGRLSVNTAVFNQVIRGFQLVERGTDLAFHVRRLAEVRSSGVEVEAMWRLTSGLSLQQAITYNDAHYTNDPGNLSYAGKRVELAPAWTSVSSVSYTFPVGSSGLTGLTYLDARYVSDQFSTGFDPLKVQKGYALVNGRIGLIGADNGWRAELWARNLFDQNYVRRMSSSVLGTLGAFLGDPRTFGVTVRKNY